MQRMAAAYEAKYGKPLQDLDVASKVPVDAAKLRAKDKLAQIKKQMSEVPGHHN